MYSLETKNQFIELRAQGLSLDAISAQLSVPKTTLGRWHHDSLEQIQRLRALQWHLLEEQIGHRLEDSLQRIAQRIRKWEDEVDSRNPQHRKTPEIVRMIRDSRREYLQLRALLLAPLQPTRSRTAGATSLDSQKRDKTGQNPDALTTTPLPPNDLQRPETSMSHSAEAAHPPVTPDVRRGLTSPEPSANPDPSTADAAHDPAANHLHASSPEPIPESATLDLQSTDAAVASVCAPVTPEVTRGLTSPDTIDNTAPQMANAEDHSQIDDEDDDFLGSVVVSPYECGAAVVLKTLQQQSAHRQRQAARTEP